MSLSEESIHPAANWASGRNFSEIEIDCTTTVMLKILDGKCKMLPGEKAAIMEIYKVVRSRPGSIFDAATHQLIDKAWEQNDDRVKDRVHALRLYAEQSIPKPVMKTYKAMLRDGLFG